MATKAQIAKRIYKCSLGELTSGEKANVTKKFKAQNAEPVTERYTGSSTTGTVLVKFARPSVNGTKESLVTVGTSVGKALEQSGLNINPTKEGLIIKKPTSKAGEIAMFNDPVIDGALYVITPGIDSQI